MESRFHYRFLHRNHDSIVNHNPKKKFTFVLQGAKKWRREGLDSQRMREGKRRVGFAGWVGEEEENVRRKKEKVWGVRGS